MNEAYDLAVSSFSIYKQHLESCGQSEPSPREEYDYRRGYENGYKTLLPQLTQLGDQVADMDKELGRKDKEIEELKKPELEKHQTCGCVVCTCDDEVQCHGCGASHCGKHPVGQIPNPVYKRNALTEELLALRARLEKAIHVIEYIGGVADEEVWNAVKTEYEYLKDLTSSSKGILDDSTASENKTI